jgi:hypothetical protein
MVTALGPSSASARWIISTLYQQIQQARVPSIAGAFARWQQAMLGLPGNSLDRLRQDTSKESAENDLLPGPVHPPSFLFAVQTYFVMITRLLAAEILGRSDPTAREASPSFLVGLSSTSFDRQFRDLCRLDDGRLFRDAGVEEPPVSGLFGWYLDGYDQSFAVWMATLARAVHEFVEGVLQQVPARDLLKDLYQALVPKRYRAALGEFYTPDWLADLVLDEVGYQGDPQMTLLDPACGSGTFLVQAISRGAGQDRQQGPVAQAEHLAQALRMIAGLDLNPVAVEAARTNLLLQLWPQLPRMPRPIRLPVYCADAIVTPREVRDLYGHVYRWTTAAGDVDVPAMAVQDGWLLELLRVADQFSGVPHESAFPAERFLEAAKARIGAERVTQAGNDLVSRCALQWCRVKRAAPALSPEAAVGACMPLRLGKRDRVVGNPPWIRWRAIGPDYRQATLPLWVQYGLFPLKGLSTILGAGEKDFSMLFTYRCADLYLKPGGRLGFLVTMEALRSKEAGQGFRRFRLGDQGDFLRVHRVHDLVAVAPFPGVGNKAALLVLERGAKTTFPVPFIEWVPADGRVSAEWKLDEVRSRTQRLEKMARPVTGRETAPWRVIEAARGAARHAPSEPKEPEEPGAGMEGPAAYRAYRGASTEPYGVYRMRLKGKRSATTVTVENLPEQGKRDVPKLRAVELESALVYPAVRGSDIRRWHAAVEICVVLPHDPVRREGYSEEWLSRSFPKTYAYLKRFKPVLVSRASQAIQTVARKSSFYAMYGIGPYTLAPYKVIWQRQATDLHAAVVGPVRVPGLGTKPAVPTDTTALIPAADPLEAHYLCGVLNAAATRAYVRSFTTAGRRFGSPSILEHIQVSRFDPRNRRHRRIAELSQQAHRLAQRAHRAAAGVQARTKPSKLEQIEWELDDLVRSVFRHKPTSL